MTLDNPQRTGATPSHLAVGRKSKEIGKSKVVRSFPVKTKTSNAHFIQNVFGFSTTVPVDDVAK